METITDESTAYILETTDADSVNSDENQIIYIKAPITPVVIRSNPQQICTVLQNENSLLKANKNPVKRLSNTVQCSDVNDNKRSLHQSLKQEPSILNHIQKLPRKKMSYERDSKPVLPSKESYSCNIFNRKRKLLVDQHTVIGARQFKRQIINTHDIVASPELAPRTKKEMHRLLNGITKMFAYPAHKIRSSQLLQLYVANCTSREQPNAEIVTDMELLPIADRIPEKETKKRPFITYERRVVEKKENNTETLVSAIESVNDHKYSKEIKEDSVTLITDEGITICSNELTISDANQEENEVITEELDTKLLNDNGEECKIVIIHQLGENISLSQKKLEALLAAANADQVIICNTTDIEDGYVIVQNDENGDVENSDFVLSD